MVKFSKTDLGILAIFKMELFVTTYNVSTYNNGQYLLANTVHLTSLLAKLKLDENGHTLKVASDTPSCFVDMLLHFFENANYFLFH